MSPTKWIRNFERQEALRGDCLLGIGELLGNSDTS